MRPAATARSSTSIGIRTILPSSSQSWAIASIRLHCENGRQIATSSMTRVVQRCLELVQSAEVAPAIREVECLGVIEEARHAEAKLLVLLELPRERLATRSRAENKNETLVPALPPLPLHDQAEKDSAGDGGGRL